VVAQRQSTSTAAVRGVIKVGVEVMA